MNGLKQAPWFLFLKLIFGYLIGYIANKKIVDSVVKEQNSEFKRIAISTAITGAAGYGFTKTPKQYTGFIAGIVVGSGTNTVMEVIKHPSINSSLPESIRNFAMSGDTDIVSENQSLRDTLGEVYQEYNQLREQIGLNSDDTSTYLEQPNQELLEYDSDFDLHGEDPDMRGLDPDMRGLEEDEEITINDDSY